MKKITIEIVVDDNHSEAEVRRTLNATGAYCALHDMNEWLRAQVKWGDEIGADWFDKARDQLHSIMNDHSINLDEDLT